jgi:selenide,water dikinase
MVTRPLRLTELAARAGCTAKTGAATLVEVVRYLTHIETGEHPDLLVGLSAPDDAAVYRVTDELAVVLTVDFFAPLVDDPYKYGAIAAANAMSDVYAMGGEVTLALNVAAFPEELDAAVIAQILRGGADKVAEAGAVTAGGHTVIDAEPKYGLCVMGTVDPRQIYTKAGVKPGDRLYLTKPLGTGLVTTAAKFQEAETEHLEAAICSMTHLNRDGSRIAREVGVGALTDVTGFGLLGHAYEMSAASGARIRLFASSIPTLPGAMEYAHRGIYTGGAARNRRYLEDKIFIDEAVSDEIRQVLLDPQTSGGLLIAVDAGKARRLEREFERAGVPCWAIGDVVEGAGLAVAA